MEDPPPESEHIQRYIPYQQWPEYKVENDPPNFFKPEKLQNGETIGARWHLGPFHFEESVTDTEPTVESNHHNRYVFWQRIYRRDIPKGWHTGFSCTLSTTNWAHGYKTE